MLIANGNDGFYFGSPCRGNHGGLHRDESRCVFSIGAPSLPAADWRVLESALTEELKLQRDNEKRSFNSLTDVASVITRMISEFGTEEPRYYSHRQK